MHGTSTREGVSLPLAGAHRFPVCVRGCHLPQGPHRRPSRQSGGGERHRVTVDGGRDVLGLDVGDSEDGAFWTAFLRSLKARGLAGCSW